MMLHTLRRETNPWEMTTKDSIHRTLGFDNNLFVVECNQFTRRRELRTYGGKSGYDIGITGSMY